VGKKELKTTIFLLSRLVMPDRFKKTSADKKNENTPLSILHKNDSYIDDIMFWSGVVASSNRVDLLEQAAQMFNSTERTIIPNSLVTVFQLHMRLDDIWRLIPQDPSDMEPDMDFSKKMNNNKLHYKKMSSMMIAEFMKVAAREPNSTADIKSNTARIVKISDIVCKVFRKQRFVSQFKKALTYNADDVMVLKSSSFVNLIIQFVFKEMFWGLFNMKKPRNKLVSSTLEVCYNALLSWFDDITIGFEDGELTSKMVVNMTILFQVSTCIIMLWKYIPATKRLPSAYGSVMGTLVGLWYDHRMSDIKKYVKNRKPGGEMKTINKIGRYTVYYDKTAIEITKKASKQKPLIPYDDWLSHIHPLHFCLIMNSTIYS
jgi:hypothetical protein